MTMLKSRAAHLACGVIIQEYLDRDGRALAHDYSNLTGADEKRAWAYFMDKERTAAGNDQPWHGKRAVTYQHFIISPDPSDNVDLDTLRDITMEWVNEFFGGGIASGKLGTYQVAVTYHDDNTHRIPHAHVIVNNTDLDSGYRLQISNRQNKELASRLQEMAKARDLHYFGGDPNEQKAGRYYTKVERALKRNGMFCWKDDLANKIDIAQRTTTNKTEFESQLGKLGVQFEERDGDYLFRHPSNPERWKVAGYRLGKSYTPESIEKSFELARLHNAPRDERLRENVTGYVMGNGGVEPETIGSESQMVAEAGRAARAAEAVKLADDYNLRSIEDWAQRQKAVIREIQRMTGIIPDSEKYKGMYTLSQALERGIDTVVEAKLYDGVDLRQRHSASPNKKSSAAGTHGNRKGADSSGPGASTSFRRALEGGSKKKKRPKGSGTRKSKPTGGKKSPNANQRGGRPMR